MIAFSQKKANKDQIPKIDDKIDSLQSYKQKFMSKCLKQQA